MKNQETAKFYNSEKYNCSFIDAKNIVSISTSMKHNDERMGLFTRNRIYASEHWNLEIFAFKKIYTVEQIDETLKILFALYVEENLNVVDDFHYSMIDEFLTPFVNEIRLDLLKKELIVSADDSFSFSELFDVNILYSKNVERLEFTLSAHNLIVDEE